MQPCAQYFLPVETLQAIIRDFFPATEEQQKTQAIGDNSIFKDYVPGARLKGILFTPGKDEEGTARLFAFPAFSLAHKDAKLTEYVIVQNLSLEHAGCPYPPPCGPQLLTTNAG